MNRIVTFLLGAPSCLLLLLLDSTSHAFAPASGGLGFSHQYHVSYRPSLSSSSSSSLRSSEVVAAVETTESCSDNDIQIDPKEAVKLFGRLAEKYISECFVVDSKLYDVLYSFANLVTLNSLCKTEITHQREMDASLVAVKTTSIISVGCICGYVLLLCMHR